ncbi:MAG TPA: NAD kinase [Burkholderiaceae bacterium]
MSTPFRHVALFGKYQAEGVRPILEEIARFLVRSGVEVSVDRDTAQNTGWQEFGALQIDELAQVCDLAVVVGGDGTMLGIGRELARHGIPLIGINQGRLGFITDIPHTDWREALVPMIQGNYEAESRPMIEGGVWRDGNQIFQGFALNDVVVRSGSSSMIELRVAIGSEYVANIRSDGVIVASPTGSTAYALSAGGPILHPGIGGWAMVPVASHTLSNRPIVIPDDQEVTLELVQGREASANFDMHGMSSMLLGDTVRMQRSAHKARFLHPRGWSYYATLRNKLHWHEGTT